jgi:hypothetical protein
MDAARFVTSTRRLSMLATRHVLLPLLLVLALTLPAAGPSLSALRTGTNNAETLRGTDGNDQLNGMGQGDSLIGKAGNDTYYFGDNFSTPGVDRLIEKPGEGTDTINFRGVTSGPVEVDLVREWASTDGYRATGPGGEVNLIFNDVGGPVKSFIETVVGGRGSGDIIATGGGAHTLQPGGGGYDNLFDFGGYNEGPGGNPTIAASNDVFKGFADNTGDDYVLDWGGSADVLDMRPFATDDVYIAPLDFDAGGVESLQIVTGPSSQVLILGHFSPYGGSSQDGRMERIVFADQTITDSSALRRAGTESLNPRQARLAKAAPKLARQARAQLARHDLTGTKATGRSGDATADGRRAADGSRALPASEASAKKSKSDKKANQAKKAKARQGAKPRSERPGNHRRR